MASYSKITLFFIISALALVTWSCSKKNDVIPDVHVDFTLDLDDPQFTVLNAIGGSVSVDGRTNNWGSYAAGFAGNGIIISRGADEFYAYDGTCPHDYALDGSSVRVKIDVTGFASAVCPKCGTMYDLLSGNPLPGGIGRYSLKYYRTSFDGSYVRVWNSY